MNHLEILLKSAKGMLEQGCRSTSLNNSDDFKYFGEHALNGIVKCGIGHLIDPEHYSPELEGKRANHPMVQTALRLSGIADVSEGYTKILLSKIQRIHDSRLPVSWKGEFLSLAEEYLSMEEFQTFCDEIAEY